MKAKWNNKNSVSTSGKVGLRQAIPERRELYKTGEKRSIESLSYHMAPMLPNFIPSKGDNDFRETP